MPSPANTENMKSAENKIRGVFSLQSEYKTGNGSTQRKSTTRVFYFAQENDSGNIELQLINKNYIPYGKKMTITKEVLVQKYSPEPVIYFNKVKPASRELVKKNDRGEKHRKQKEYFNAEYEFKNALNIDENNIRATFNLGINYLDRNDPDKANEMFVKLVQLKEPFEKQHKHLFNEFGIKLRKHKMFKQALKYYGRAYKLEKNDDHLYFNMARIFYEMNKLNKCKNLLNKALSINPNLKEANKLFKKLEKIATQI